ncbi:MAG TPA: hypothetical protein VGF44_04635, partial [Terriglobales bacterium]
MSTTQTPLAPGSGIYRAAGFPSRILYALVSNTPLLFLATLAIILFRPPDLPFHAIDRIAIVALAYLVVLRVCLHRQPLQLSRTVN